MLGPLTGLGSRFLELLVIVHALGFNSLRLPDAVRRVIYAPGMAAGEIALGEQSRPDLLWPVDILLGVGGNAILSGRWRAFALGHRLHVGDHLVFRFKLRSWRPRCGSSPLVASAAPTPSPRRSEEEALAR
jgi:hypothetical protein